jgi:hypothetical protein
MIAVMPFQPIFMPVDANYSPPLMNVIRASPAPGPTKIIGAKHGLGNV